MSKTVFKLAFLLFITGSVLISGCKESETELEKKLLEWEVPQHPYLAGNGRSNLHNDAFMTDVYRTSGPEGDALHLNSFDIARIFITIAFNQQGQVVTLGTGSDGKRAAYLLSPDSLKVIDSYELPASADLSAAGAGYFYLDNQDRMVVPTTNKHIFKLKIQRNPPGFLLDTDYDLSALPNPCHLVSILPDWNGNIWFISEEGRVGIVVQDGSYQSTILTHKDGETEVQEAIKNSFALDDQGLIYLVTDYALYALEADKYNCPSIVWREEYDRGSRIKPGQFLQGSGTTPTLISDSYISIADNADPRMNILVYKRKRNITGNRLLCKIPVFTDNASADENSLIAFGNSILVENNYGHEKPADLIGKYTEPGMARIDFKTDGTYSVVWDVDEIIPSVVSKVALGNSTVYTYTKEVDGWYLSGLDLDTGIKKFQTRAGGDQTRFNNYYSGIAIGPDGSAYIGCVGGIIRFSE